MDGGSALEERLKLLAQYVSDLREFEAISLEEYLNSKMIRAFVERRLQTAIECCLDIGHTIIAAAGFRCPRDSRDVFVVLGEEGLLSREMVPRLTQMASFRNRLVHEYARLDDSRVHSILQTRLDDFDAFARAIAIYLST
ncbi:MAG: type VII toxin-antitoxin system HepT family RNase toxin [Anaerolineae bacterium]